MAWFSQRAPFRGQLAPMLKILRGKFGASNVMGSALFRDSSTLRRSPSFGLHAHDGIGSERATSEGGDSLVAGPMERQRQDRLFKRLMASLLCIVFFSWSGSTAQADSSSSNVVESPNGTGIARTITTRPSFDGSNPFFKPLGTNGRSCATCHVLSEGLNMNPEYAQSLFDLTEVLDPLFASVDGTNSPRGDMSTLAARRGNTLMLRTKGLFRVSLALPAKAEFTIDKIIDPYSNSTPQEISVFRRPLPSTNLRFLGSVMWDGREFINTGSVGAALRSQVRDAVLGHMQASAPPLESEISAIVDFETHIYTTQVFDNKAGRLDTSENRASPKDLISVPFAPGINRFFGPKGRSPFFDNNVLTLFKGWAAPSRKRTPPLTAAQEAVARGQRLFNNRGFAVSGVAGFNDVVNDITQDTIAGRRGPSRPPFNQERLAVRATCSSCHNTPQVGGNSLPLFMNTGTAEARLGTSDMPLYTLRNKATGERIVTTDPGVAMTTGKWGDIGKFKVPSLRGLETHSPYFHQGFTGDLKELINFYDARFKIGLSQGEKEDLEAFLVTL